MQFLASLFSNLAYLNPIPLAGWLVWLGLAGLLGVALYNWRTYQLKLDSRAWGIFAGLVLSTFITTFFIGLEFSSGSALPVPGLPQKAPGSTLMLFSAILMDIGGWLARFICGGGAGHLKRFVARGVGYAQPLHDA